MKAGKQGLAGPSSLQSFWKLARTRDGLLPFIQEQIEKYGYTFRISLFSKKIDFFCDPRHIREIFIDQRACFENSFDKMKIFLGNGLTVADGEDWKYQRRLLQPIFSAESLASFAPIMVDECQKMIQRWEKELEQKDSIEVNLADEVLFSTLNLATRSFFSVEVSKEAPQIEACLDQLMGAIFDRIRYPAFFSYLPTRKNFRTRRAHQVMNVFIYALIRDRRGHRRKSETLLKKDLIETLIETKDSETQASFTDKEIRDQIITFLAVGHETTASTLTWTLSLLAENPEAFQRVRNEFHQSAQKNFKQKTISPKASADLAYTMRVFQETMRLYPSAWCQTRKAIQDCQIGPHHIKKGTRIAVSSYFAQRHPDFWDQPDAFQPDRFLNLNLAENKGAYFPFGLGGRACIGQYFAQMTYQAFIPALVGRFSFERVDPDAVEMDSRVSLRPKGGLRLRVFR